MGSIAVITGDLIDSTRVANTKAFQQCLGALLSTTQEKFDALVSTYRGDGFQVALGDAINPFRVALLLRTGLIGHSPDSAERWDARLAIAFGEGKLSRTDQNSPAYVQSGQSLDAMKNDHLLAVSESEAVSLALGVACRFADDILNNLTAVEAQVLHYYLLEQTSHQSIADQLGKQRPTITLALQRARYKLLHQFVEDMDQMVRICNG